MIPTSFRLINRGFVVEELDHETAEDIGAHGDFSLEKGRLRIKSAEDNMEWTEHTFLHELVHALLESSSKPKLSKNEAFVDSLAGVLHQYLKTKKGKLF